MTDHAGPDAGFLVLADISGFTAFVTTTEIEHGAQITAALLESVMRRLAPPLEIQELEGDAVFAIGSDRVVPDGSVLPRVVVDAFTTFKDEQRQMARDETCSCGACRAVPDLDLKVVAHHGRFVRQTVGGRSRVAGPDVILVHRLLKNPVGGGAYLLLTASALERIGPHPVLAGTRHLVARYAHFGDVLCAVADLGDHAQDAARVERSNGWSAPGPARGHPAHA
ncbi:MAG: DUF2652 domain-containing protein [Candidatus Rokubacteria bacterium]|nr:DUF2652 domain-containing protein [Candidatus Rokubacteria bacterium]